MSRLGTAALVAALASASVLGGRTAAALDADHGVLTTIELSKCQSVRRDTAVGKAWTCPGITGYPVSLSEVDDRTFLSVGPKPEQRRAARQTLRAPNTLFAGGAIRATIEWRVAQLGPGKARVKPYATIVRYTTARDTARGQVIIVSKVTPTETCHVALIDALANADALALARAIADTSASTFDCSKPPAVHGLNGKSPL